MAAGNNTLSKRFYWQVFYALTILKRRFDEWRELSQSEAAQTRAEQNAVKAA